MERTPTIAGECSSMASSHGIPPLPPVSSLFVIWSPAFARDKSASRPIGTNAFVSSISIGPVTCTNEHCF